MLIKSGFDMPNTVRMKSTAEQLGLAPPFGGDRESVNSAINADTPTLRLICFVDGSSDRVIASRRGLSMSTLVWHALLAKPGHCD